MKAHECFGVVIRTLGMLVLIAFAVYLYSAVVALIAPDARPGSRALDFWGATAVLLIIGLYLLRGAPHLMRFAYPKAGGRSDEKVEA
jgi:hypothetical protein